MDINQVGERTFEFVMKIISIVTTAIGVEIQCSVFPCQEIPNVADFFAWQIVCDLLELKVIYFDENSWTCLGPGAKHGLEKIFPNLAEGRMLESAKALYRNMNVID